MKLEEEILQKKFSTEEQKLIINIHFTSNWLSSYSEKLFKEFNLTNQQFNILRILRGQHPNPASIKLLKERMIDRNCDASRLVDNIVKKGFAERAISKYDRRQSNITITISGLKILAAIDKKMPEFELFLDNLSKEEMKSLNQLLDKLRG